MLGRPEAALFALALGVYAYFYQAGGWNQNARFDLVRAIVERGTLRIDAYESNTGDKAERDGHLYSDKAPGVSLTALPMYAAVHALGGRGAARRTASRRWPPTSAPCGRSRCPRPWPWPRSTCS